MRYPKRFRFKLGKTLKMLRCVNSLKMNFGYIESFRVPCIGVKAQSVRRRWWRHRWSCCSYLDRSSLRRISIFIRWIRCLGCQLICQSTFSPFDSGFSPNGETVSEAKFFNSSDIRENVQLGKFSASVLEPLRLCDRWLLLSRVRCLLAALPCCIHQVPLNDLSQTTLS